jgi:hypothetical protein
MEMIMYDYVCGVGTRPTLGVEVAAEEE